MTPVSSPVRVTIPALGLDEELLELGLDDSGALEVPTDFARVGWYGLGSRPGEPGPTVLAGHVDSRDGPAVFFDLGTLQVGDQATLADAGGIAHTYEVYQVESYPKDSFPTSSVFGATLDDELRLITCDGTFDRAAGSYEDNLVVYARRVP